ncbi:MAG: HAMP domain-containing sensor histidine kinase [Euryarchaeota archaeon]|nr:HAMP domain-containing sensor histidine kinase [Euryarchaeota archaeon]
MGLSIYRKLVIWFVLVSLLSLGLATTIGIHPIGAIVVTILLSLIIAGILARNISAPISELAHTAEAILDGDFTKRVNTGRDDEIGELVVAFNRMADVLEENTDAVEEKTVELKRVNAELKELDQLKSEFISIASHELRTPLTTLRGYLELALDGTLGEFTELQTSKLKIMNRNTDRLIGLITDLLNLSDIQSGQLHIVKENSSLIYLVDEAVRLIKPLADSKGHEIVVNVPGNIILSCDLARIAYALRHLLDDSVRFTTEPGTIEITAEYQVSDVYIRVSDTGIGIPESELENIFIPFYELKGSMQHTTGTSGLGLSIVKGIVEAHGGMIWVESEIGAGTVFHIVVPRG